MPPAHAQQAGCLKRKAGTPKFLLPLYVSQLAGRRANASHPRHTSHQGPPSGHTKSNSSATPESQANWKEVNPEQTAAQAQQGRQPHVLNR
ncbi:hypothetical protein NDU88_004672 [Pleurodeles waltl]|uniref:Uncharacterized protein n=1 Tax=Pleurodeles waltl TaxID=8319 RepID=A0AAV7MAQ3_PLEWA|nr:hypothetical protein NDU88_004672 [Pleurodeles waltl]